MTQDSPHGFRRISILRAAAVAALLFILAYVVTKFLPAHLPYPGSLDYQVIFTWDEGIKDLRVINEATGREEKDRALRQMVASEAEKTLPTMIEQLALRRAEGTLYCTLVGSKQLYRVRCNNSYEATMHIHDPDALKPMLIAAEKGDVAAIENLVRSGADVNAGDQHGKTALIRAVHLEDTAALRALVAAGAKLNAQDSQGRTALFYATDEDNLRAVRVLIAAGADVNVADSKGETALMDAAGGHDPEIVKALLSSGANVNATNGNGETALMHAVWFGTPAVVQVLLMTHANANIRSKTGHTALDLARSTQRSDIESLLRKAGASK